MNVFVFFEIDSPVAGQNGSLVDDFATMIISAHVQIHVIIKGVTEEGPLLVGKPDVPLKMDKLFAHQVFHVIRIDIDRIIVIDMDIAEAFDVVLVGVHPEAVAKDQRRFLLDLDMMNERRDRRHGIHLFGMIGLVAEDLDDFDRVAVCRFECNLPPGARGECEEQDADEYPNLTNH